MGQEMENDRNKALSGLRSGSQDAALAGCDNSPGGLSGTCEAGMGYALALPVDGNRGR